MYNTIKHESEVEFLGLKGRAYNVVADDSTGRIRNQKIKPFTRYWKEGANKYGITVTLRFDDDCNNRYETFSITGETHRNGREDSCGCIHELIAAHYPELTHLIKWHLVSTNGPLHYISNTIFNAGDRDCWKLRKGETRQIINGSTGKPCWTLVARNAPGVMISKTPTGDEYREREVLPLFILDHDATGEKPTTVPVLEWAPLLKYGEGKARELDHARNSAVWPEATDEELTQEPAALKAQLEARLPALLADFKAAMLSVGFLWPERVEAAGAE